MIAEAGKTDDGFSVISVALKASPAGLLRYGEEPLCCLHCAMAVPLLSDDAGLRQFAGACVTAPPVVEVVEPRSIDRL